MLCFQHNEKLGEICTNRCPDRPTCNQKRSPLFIHALTILASDIEPKDVHGVHTIAIKSYCLAPEDYENGLLQKIYESKANGIRYNMTDAFSQDLIGIKCHNPGCKNYKMILISQERELMTDDFTKYYDLNYIYCSDACRREHIKNLSVSKSVAVGSLKNRDYALVIKGAKTSRRLKNDKEFITGNKEEQRIGCIRAKLLSTSERRIQLIDKVAKGKFLYPSEIQEFLLNDVPPNIKVSSRWARVAASEYMNKCKLTYPKEISIEQVDEKTRVLFYIKPLL